MDRYLEAFIITVIILALLFGLFVSLNWAVENHPMLLIGLVVLVVGIGIFKSALENV
ncbi:hypothetical protein [Weissella muntiaci]|uniref:hypothetical protein n=1 Tax=Weissella muntiaci TaxID=2508881 RepID=UPI00165206FF|nr:hypothetical protein [Weissella muntiaci]